MPDADHIQYLIDRGRGMAAKHLGVNYAAYRPLTTSTALNYLDPVNQVNAGWPVYFMQKPAGAFRGSFEGTNVKIPLYDIIADMTPFIVGDVFVSTDTPYVPYGGALTADLNPITVDNPQQVGAQSGYGAGATRVAFPTIEIDAFCLAFHGPIKKSIGARLDRIASFYRMAAAPANGYFSADTNAASPVVLSNGVFSVGSVGATPAQVPVGISVMPRWRGELVKSIPTTSQVVEYFIYVPPLNGFTFEEGDQIEFQDGSRYFVQVPYEQMVGFAGSQLGVERVGMQT